MDIEHEIHDIHEKFEKVFQLTNDMSGKLIIFEERQKNETEARKDLSEDFKLLNKTLIDLNTTMTAMNSRKEGVSSTIKMVWTIFGSLFLALAIGAMTTIVQLKEEVAALKTLTEVSNGK